MVTDPHKKLTPPQAAERIGLSTGHLANLRTNGGGPPYLKLGRKVMYALGDVDAWIESKRRTQSPPRVPGSDKRKKPAPGEHHAGA